MMEQEIIDYVSLRRLQNTYADIVNRRAWNELHHIFRPDITVSLDLLDQVIELIGPDEVGNFIGTSIAHMDLFEFVILNTVIDIDGDSASARMFMWELRHDPEAGRTDAYGLYRDQFVRRDGKWWFARRRYQSLGRVSEMGSKCVTFPLPTD